MLLMAGPDHQQAGYPTYILCHKQQSSHTSRNRWMTSTCSHWVTSPVPMPWRVPQSLHGDPASPSQVQPFPPQALHCCTS